MRRAVPLVAAAVLLVGPTVLAFYSGGYFTEPRLVAAIVTWLLVLVVAVTGPPPLPRSGPGALALGGLALITVWSAVSLAWAPLGGPAIHNVQRLVLYVGVLTLAIGLLRVPRLMRGVEPVLAAGATIVIGYGLAGRLLPGIVQLAQSSGAGGRLEQPITYWNGEGALAAVGFVLCARLAGDGTRPAAIRGLAAAAATPLAAGIYLSFSRGAIAVAIVGLVILVTAAPDRAQLRAALLVLVAGCVAAGASSAFGGVASLAGEPAARERDGAIVLAILVLVATAAGLLTARQVAAQRGKDMPRRLPARRRLVMATLVVGGVTAGLVIGGLQEKAATHPAVGANATRLTSVSSNRYEYWRVAARGFEHHPLQGLGSGGFRVLWLRDRPISESVQEVHSLELEMATELGLVGLLAFATMIGGVGWAARHALRRDPAAAAGLLAAALTWLLHASIDWDWQLPTVTLPALILAAALVVLGEVEHPVTSEADGQSSRRGARAASEPSRLVPTA